MSPISLGTPTPYSNPGLGVRLGHDHAGGQEQHRVPSSKGRVPMLYRCGSVHSDPEARGHHRREGQRSVSGPVPCEDMGMSQYPSPLCLSLFLCVSLAYVCGEIKRRPQQCTNSMIMRVVSLQTRPWLVCLAFSCPSPPKLSRLPPSPITIVSSAQPTTPILNFSCPHVSSPLARNQSRKHRHTQTPLSTDSNTNRTLLPASTTWPAP